MRFSNRTAIITGAGGGLGKAYAKAILSEGGNVVIAEFDDVKGKSTEKEFKENGWNVLFVHCDVSKEEDVINTVNKTLETFGNIDILINNAQCTNDVHATVENTSIEMVKRCWETGFLGAFMFEKYCLPHMKKNQYGRIVNIASATGALGQEGFSAYGSNKEAMRGLTRITAVEYGAYGITCNSITPNALTEPAQIWAEANPEQYKAICSTLILKRMGDLDKDIAPIVAFLASEDSRYVTAQTIGADGIIRY